MIPRRRVLGLAGLVVVLAALLVLPASPFGPSPAAALGLPCPGSVNLLGLVTVNVDCTIAANTVWGNGTLALGGNLTVLAGYALTLWNVTLRFTPSYDEQFRIVLDGGRLVARGGTLTSGTPGYGWHLETTTAAGALADLQGTNVSYAGGAATPGFLLRAGTGHRFERLAVTASAVGSTSGTAVVRLAGAAVDDVRVENSTFSGSGCAFLVDGLVGGTHLVFANNRITGFTGDPSSAAVFPGNTQVLDNTIDAGGATGIEVWGGGPGWPATNAYAVSGNTVTTTGDAVATVNSAGYDIMGNTILGGHVVFDGSGNRFAYNNVTGTDERSSPGHIVWTSPNSSFDHNTLWNVGLTTDSGFLVTNYGNVKVTDNVLRLGCYGNNCMAIETINVQSAQRAVYPGWPTVEIARNRITWATIASNGVTIMLDNEFSEREWLHDNVEAVTDPYGRATSSLQGGGVMDSVYENNTILGPTTWCIYEYIYSDAGNLFQNNRCDNAAYAGIFQTGGNVYRDNVFTNLSSAGIWICPNTSCAGSNTNVMNNAWYNNSFSYRSSSQAFLTQMTASDALNNSFVGHGASEWTDGNQAYPVYGDWLFFANTTISHLAFADAVGTRTLTLTAGGQTYWDREGVPGLNDGASLAVDGSLDPQGSLYGNTVLWSLNPYGVSALYLMGVGAATLTLRGFAPDHAYTVTLLNRSTGTSQTGTATTDAAGSGTVPVSLGPTMSPYSVQLDANAPPPTGDTTPPAGVSDLRVVQTGSDYVVLQWTTPGNNGTVGQASQYDLRFSTTGPLDNATFAAAPRVSTPPPGLPGTTMSFNVSGLTAGTLYWFALRTADAVPNWSPISNNANATTLPPGAGSSSPPAPAPKVVSATWLADQSALDLVFSKPMDTASVNTSLRITPQIAYRLDWLNDTHLRVVLLQPPVPGTVYVVTLSRTATDVQGNGLATGFTYPIGVPQTQPVVVGPVPLPGLRGLLSLVALAASVFLTAMGCRTSVTADRAMRRRRRVRRGRGPRPTPRREAPAGVPRTGDPKPPGRGA